MVKTEESLPTVRPNSISQQDVGPTSLSVQLTDALTEKQILEQKLNELDSNYNSVCDENDRLTKTVKEKQNEILTIEETLEGMSEQLHQLEDADKQKEGHICNLKEKISFTENKLLQATNEFKEHETKYTSLYDDHQQKVMECKNLQAEVSDLIADKEVKSQELEKLRDINTKQSEELESCHTTCQEFQKDINALKEQVEENDKISADNAATIRSLEEELRNQISLTESSQSEVEKLQSEIELLQEKVTATLKTVKKGEIKFDELQADYTILVEKNERQQVKIADLQADLESKSSVLEQVNQEKFNLKNNVESLTASSEELRQEVATLQREIAEKEDTLGRRDSALVELQRELDAQVSATEDGIRKMSMLQESFDNLRKSSALSLETIKRNEDSLSELQSKYSSKTAECESHEVATATANSEKDRILVELNQLKASHTTKVKELESLQLCHAELESEISTLRSTVDETEKENSSNKVLILALQSDLKDEFDRAGSYEKEVSKMKSDFDVMESKHRDEVVILTSQLEEKSGEIARLSAVESNLSEDVEQLRKKNSDLKSEIQSMESSLMAESSTGEEKLQAMLAAKMDLEAKHATLMEDRNELLSRNREQEERIRSLSASEAKNVTEKERLFTELRDRENELRELQSANDEMEDGLSSMKAKMATEIRNTEALQLNMINLDHSLSSAKERIAELEVAEAALLSENKSCLETVEGLKLNLKDSMTCRENLVAQLATMEAKLENVSSLHATTSKDLSNLKDLIVEKENVVQEKECQRLELEVKVSTIEQEYNVISATLREREEALGFEKGKVTKNLAEIDRLLTALSSTKDEMQHLQRDADDRITELSVVTADLKKGKEELELRKDNEEKLQRDLSGLKLHCEETENEIAKLQASNGESKAAYDIHIASLVSEIDSANEEIDVLTSKVTELTEDLSKFENNNSKLRKEIKDMEESISKDQTSAASALLSSRKEFEGVQEKLQADLDSKSNELTAVTASLEAKMDELKRMTSFNTALTDENADLNAKCADYELKLAEIQTEYDQGQRSMKDMESSMATLQHEHKMLQISAEEASNALEINKFEYEKEKKELMSQCQSTDSVVASLKAELLVKNQKLENLSGLNSTQGDEFDSLRSKCEALQARVETLETTVADREQDLSTSAASILALQSDLKDEFDRAGSYEKEVSKMKSDFNVMESRHRDEVVILTSQLEEKNGEIARLSAVESNLSEDVEQLRKKNSDLKSEILSMESSLMAESSTGEEKLQAMLAAKMDLEAKHATLMEDRNELLSRNREQEERIRVIQAETSRDLTLEKTKFTKLQGENDDMAYELSMTLGKLQTAESQLSESLLEVKSLSAKKEKYEHLYNQRLEHSGSSEESCKKENLELRNQLSEVEQKSQSALLEAQAEIADLIATVVDSKMAAAAHATEVNESRVKMKTMKQRLQLYAERVAALEVAVAEATTSADEDEDEDSSGFTAAIRRYFWGKKS